MHNYGRRELLHTQPVISRSTGGGCNMTATRRKSLIDCNELIMTSSYIRAREGESPSGWMCRQRRGSLGVARPRAEVRSLP